MLNKEQRREYNRAARTKEFFDGNKERCDSYEPFKNEVLEFKTAFENFTKFIPGKDIVSKGITTGKTLLKRSLAKKLDDVCRKVHAYALKVNNTELAAQTADRKESIFKKADSDLTGYSVSILKIISSLLDDAKFITYGITAAQLQQISTAAAEFNGMIGEAKEESSGIGSANILLNQHRLYRR